MSGDLLRLPPNFLQDLAEYIPRVQKEAGPHPAQWDADCEALAARELLGDIFRIRRGKLARIGEALTPDALETMIGGLTVPEANALTRIALAFEDLDKANGQICRTGKWSGV